jgi:hypothetical protein
MHAHVKKNISYVYVEWDFDQIVNAHAQIYDRWGITLFHIYYACLSKKKMSYVMFGGLYLATNILMFGPLGFNYDFFVNTLPIKYIESRYPPNINWNPIQCEHGLVFSMFSFYAHGMALEFHFHVLIFQPTKEKK